MYEVKAARMNDMTIYIKHIGAATYYFPVVKAHFSTGKLKLKDMGCLYGDQM